MKIRCGFVSNSSSSSFTIRLCNLSPMQVCKILNHEYWGEKLGIPYAKSDAWHITIEKGVLCGDTFMDNFDMADFFEKIGVSDSAVAWGERNHGQVLEESLDECDIMCEDCHMRFVCYTNK